MIPPFLSTPSHSLPNPSFSFPPPAAHAQRRAYKIKEWTDTEDFLTQVAKLSGRLLRGGDPDLDTVAR